MFARAEAQKIKCLLNEPVGYLGILTQTKRQRPLTWPERAGFLADEQTRRQPRLAPGPIHSFGNLFHYGLN